MPPPGAARHAAGLSLPGLLLLRGGGGTSNKMLPPLQAYRNTVPVPRHWSQKRKYLQVGPLALPPACRCPWLG